MVRSQYLQRPDAAGQEYRQFRPPDPGGRVVGRYGTLPPEPDWSEPGRDVRKAGLGNPQLLARHTDRKEQSMEIGEVTEVLAKAQRGNLLVLTLKEKDVRVLRLLVASDQIEFDPGLLSVLNSVIESGEVGLYPNRTFLARVANLRPEDFGNTFAKFLEKVTVFYGS